MSFPNPPVSGSGPKRIGEDLPPLKLQGMDFLAAAGAAGVSVQVARVTQVGASPFTVSLPSTQPVNAQNNTLRAMADTNYVVFAYDFTSQALLNVPLANIQTGQFNVTGGANNDVLGIVIIGRLAGQSA